MNENQRRLEELNRLKVKAARAAYDPYYRDIRLYTMIRSQNCDRCGWEIERGELAYWVGKGTYWCGCEPPVEKTTALKTREAELQQIRQTLLNGPAVQVKRPEGLQ